LRIPLAFEIFLMSIWQGVVRRINGEDRDGP